MRDGIFLIDPAVHAGPNLTAKNRFFRCRRPIATAMLLRRRSPGRRVSVFAHAPAAEVLATLADAAPHALHGGATAHRQPSREAMRALSTFVDAFADGRFSR